MDFENVDITGDYTLLLTYGPEGALLTARGKDHDLGEPELKRLRDACIKALAAIYHNRNPVIKLRDLKAPRRVQYNPDSVTVVYDRQRCLESAYDLSAWKEGDAYEHLRANPPEGTDAEGWIPMHDETVWSWWRYP